MPCSDLSILIIDDNPSDIELLKESFHEECRGVQLRHIADVDQALSFIRSLPPQQVPDAVLVDYRLPRSSGVVVLTELDRHAHWEKVPRIVMTGSVSAAITEQCRRAGAHDVVAKPDDFDGYLQFARKLTIRMRLAKPKPS